MGLAQKKVDPSTGYQVQICVAQRLPTFLARHRVIWTDDGQPFPNAGKVRVADNPGPIDWSQPVRVYRSSCGQPPKVAFYLVAFLFSRRESLAVWPASDDAFFLLHRNGLPGVDVRERIDLPAGPVNFNVVGPGLARQTKGKHQFAL
jgi:hypothetical protein